MSWHLDAACVGLDNDIFFERDDASEAKAICKKCPVKRQCLEEAVSNREAHGVWGGLTPHERVLLRRRRGRKQLRRPA